MIENCKNSSFAINGEIKTGTVELWRSDDIVCEIGTEVGTLQVDLSNNLTVNYSSKGYLGSIVQAGITNFKVNFTNHPELNFITGIEALKKDHGELDDKFDQFITRFVQDKLLTEKIVRYSDGFHTTDREKAVEDAERDKNEEKTMEKVRQMIKVAGPALGINENNMTSKSNQGKEEEEKKNAAESQSNLKKHAGNKAFTAGKYDQALALYNEAIILTPNNHVLYSNRATTYQQLKDLEKALADADKCIELNKAFTKGHFRRGLVMLELGKKDEAVKSLTEAHDLEPKDEEILAALNKAKQ
jgi:tetratricopeptide (TPR) repeat protein